MMDIDKALSTAWALRYSHQGPGQKRPPKGYHQVDLRGSFLLSHSGSKPVEAQLGNFFRRILITSKLYYVDDAGNPTAFPALYLRYPDSKNIDLRLDLGYQSASVQSKVDAVMHALSNSGKFQLPLVAINIDPDGGTFYRFNLVAPTPCKLDIAQLKDLPYNLLTLGDQLIINYDKEPHMLITGLTGSGKSYLLELLIAEAKIKTANPMYSSGAVYVADPKYSDLATYAERVGVDKVAQSPAQIAGMLREATETMNNRFKSLAGAIGKTALDQGLAPIFIIIDEYAALIASLNSTKDKKLADEINSYLTQLVMKGRQADVYVIIAMQRATADTLNSNLRYNLSTKIILGSSDATTVAMIFGAQDGIKLPKITQVGGGYVLTSGAQIPRQFYAWTYDRMDLLARANSLANTVSRQDLRRLVISTGRIVDQIEIKIAQKAPLSIEVAQLNEKIKVLASVAKIFGTSAPTSFNIELAKDHFLAEDQLFKIKSYLNQLGNELVYPKIKF